MALVTGKLVFGLAVALALAWTAPIREEAALPADAEAAADRLAASPRHGEWIEISEGQGASGGWHDTVRAWITYPERATRAPVVIVIHEIFGLTDWVRGVADQLAGAGYIAIAPDLLTGIGPEGKTPGDRQEAVRLIRGLRIEDVSRRLTAVGRFAAALPASNGKFGVIGFCWGGGTALCLRRLRAEPCSRSGLLRNISGQARNLADHGTGSGVLRLGRHAGERLDSSGRSGDTAAGLAVREAHLRRRWTRLPAPTVGQGRRQSEGRRICMVGDSGVPWETLGVEVIPSIETGAWVTGQEHEQ